MSKLGKYLAVATVDTMCVPIDNELRTEHFFFYADTFTDAMEIVTEQYGDENIDKVTIEIFDATLVFDINDELGNKLIQGLRKGDII